MKRYGTPLLLLVFTILCGAFFAFDSLGASRQAHIDIRNNLVAHPEFIPSAQTVHISSAWFDTVVGDFYWLSAIQYIGSNALSAEYKKYLYVILDLVTDLSPHFTYPYQIGFLLLPDVNENYERLTKEEKSRHLEETLKLGDKAIARECSAEKIALIDQEKDLKKLWSDPKYHNPCSDSMIPYYLAYIAYWSENNPAKASRYYKIASANEDALRGARVMAAVMQGKSGDRAQSILMFLSLAESIEGQKQQECSAFAQELGKILLQAYANGRRPDGKFLKEVDTVRKNIIEKLGEANVDSEEQAATFDDFCSTSLGKAVRELNLDYVSQADLRFTADKWRHALNAKELFETKYIDYLPRDFQKIKDDEIVYVFDRKTGRWDYQLGSYTP